MQNSIEDIIPLFDQPRKVVALAHRNPDGDALGSILALKLFLENLGHECTVAVPSEYPDLFAYLPNIEEVLVDDKDPINVSRAILEADVAFILDLNTLERLDRLGEILKSKAIPKILIDHHLNPEEGDFDYVFSDVHSSATCQILFRLLVQWNRTKLNDKIAKCLYTGFITDTGTFAYATSPLLFREVAELIEVSNIDHIEIQNKISNNIEPKVLKLLGFCLSNRMELLPDQGFGIIYLTSEDYKKWYIKRGDTEGIVNYVLKLKGYDKAAFVRDQHGQVRLSLRSLGDFSVEQVAKDYFRGGGHRNAAGGQSDLPLKETIEKLKTVIKHYI